MNEISPISQPITQATKNGGKTRKWEKELPANKRKKANTLKRIN